MRRKPVRQFNRTRKNEFQHRPPNVKEVRDAQKLARKVSKDLYEMLEAKEVKE